jgi:2-amino-4-hydroxy-6-hydroxymethyldihydropteridine diphosphokinase
MILIALGANLPSQKGPPAATIRAALDKFPDVGVVIRAIAPFYLSRAWPNPDDPAFVNSVALVETSYDPAHLLVIVKELERFFGRAPGPQNAPRSLDLDIVDYDGRIADGPPTLPHPRLAERGFVLVPLRDIAPEWRHPVLGRSVSDLIDALPAEARALTRLPAR